MSNLDGFGVMKVNLGNNNLNKTPQQQSNNSNFNISNMSMPNMGLGNLGNLGNINGNGLNGLDKNSGSYRGNSNNINVNNLYSGQEADSRFFFDQQQQQQQQQQPAASQGQFQTNFATNSFNPNGMIMPTDQFNGVGGAVGGAGNGPNLPISSSINNNSIMANSFLGGSGGVGGPASGAGQNNTSSFNFQQTNPLLNNANNSNNSITNSGYNFNYANNSTSDGSSNDGNINRMNSPFNNGNNSNTNQLNAANNGPQNASNLPAGSVQQTKLEYDRKRVSLILEINQELLRYAIASANDANKESPDSMYVSCMKRLQCNLAYLATLADRSKSVQSSFPQILSPPPEIPALADAYRRLQLLFPEVIVYMRRQLALKQQQQKQQQEQKQQQLFMS